jgi:hypothetical protein
MRNLLIAILFVSFSSGSLSAQEFSIELNKDSMLIGDHILMTMDLKLQEGENGFFPQLIDSVMIFDLIETYPIDTQGNHIKQQLLITQFDAGNYQIAGLPALIQRSNGAIDTVQSNSLILVVNTIEVDTSKAIKPIKTVKSIPFPWKPFLKKLALWLIPIFIILALIIWYFLRKKDIKIFKEKPKTMLDYYHEALDKLQELENEKLWQNEKVKDYYLGLSEILREYIEGRFGVHAMESTTDEIKEVLFLNRSLKEKVCEVLAQADLAKFAKFKPMGEENIRMMKLAKDFVRHTKPKNLEEQEDAK